MDKIKEEFIRNQYRSGIDNYSKFTTEIGLWKSEKYVFEKYLKKDDRILDLGCGTGRTTFPLYKSGYKDIIGIDLTPEMIEEAKRLDKVYGTNLLFEVGNAMKMKYENSQFDTIIFSFNGFMSIPNKENRNTALQEIYRVLRESGLFIFTTHDRNKENQFLSFWEEEKNRWLKGIQNPKLYEYGDLITTSKNENRKIYIHIPSKNEIEELLDENGFEVIETFYRIDKFDETEKVLKQSGECRFWITKKIDKI